MKNRNRLIFTSLGILIFLMTNQILIAAPFSAPPSPNQPDAQFNSISAGGAVAGIWTFVFDQFGALNNAKPNKPTGLGYTQAQCAADGGFLEVGDNNCHYPVTVGDSDGLKTSNIRITGGANGVAGTIGEPSGTMKYGAYFNVTNVNPLFPVGTYQGTLVKGVGEFAGGLFKYTNSDPADLSLHPNTTVQISDGTYAIDATGDVNISGGVNVSGHLHAGTIGNFYTLSKTEDVPAFSDSTMMAVSCNGSDIALSCMGGGSV